MWIDFLQHSGLRGGGRTERKPLQTIKDDDYANARLSSRVLISSNKLELLGTDSKVKRA